MAKSIFRRHSKQFLSSIAFLLLCVGSLATATYAWFYSNRTASINVTQMMVASRDIIDNVKVYPYHILTSEEGSFTEGTETFEKTPMTSEEDFGKYSLLSQNKNGLLLEVTLTDFAKTYSSISLSGHSFASVYLGEIDASTNKLKQALTTTDNSLSSIVCFYSFAASSISEETNYYSVDLSTTLNSTGVKENFVSSENTLNSDVPLCSFSTIPDKFYLVLDYDPSLIEDIYSANIGNEAISDLGNMVDGQSYITYTSDFCFVVSGEE
jgi:hypothetical protein